MGSNYPATELTTENPKRNGPEDSEVVIVITANLVVSFARVIIIVVPGVIAESQSVTSTFTMSNVATYK